MQTRRIQFGGALLALALMTACGSPGEENSVTPTASEGTASEGTASEAATEGGDDGVTRPTAQELADGMTKVMASSGSGGTFTAEQMLCIATGLEDSDLSNRLLRAMADGDESVTSTGEEQTRVSDVLTTVMIDCAA